MKNRTTTTISWILQIAAVVIMGQSLFFKFTAHPESVAIFSDINMEPYGRILVGVVELVASALLLRRSTAHYGAILGLGTMAGAIMGHFTQIGWHGDRGELGALAVIVFLCCAAIIYMRRADLPFIGQSMKRS